MKSEQRVLASAVARGIELSEKRCRAGGAVMQPDELRAFFDQRPFRPLRIHVKDGRTYDVRFRELVIVGNDYLTLGIPAPLERYAIYDFVEHVRLDEIDHIDRLGGSSVSGR